MPKKPTAATPEIQPPAGTPAGQPPPAQPASGETQPTGVPPAGSGSGPKPTVVKSTGAKTNRRKLWWLIGGGVAVIAVAAWAGWMFFLQADKNQPTVVHSQTNTNTNTLAPRVLDGVYVQPDKTNPNIYAIMIENISESRPQSGLEKASVVYEALAEGGITRFMALFPVGVVASEIGPVRSARPYYVTWAEEYNQPLYVHVGGSPQSLIYLGSGQANVVDFNQFRYAPNFWRDKTRPAPHNLYTSSELLYVGLKKVAPDLVPSYAGWQFKDEDPVDKRPSVQSDIVIDYSAFNYRVTYKYHRDLNQYFRFQGDSEQVMKNEAKIAAKNVVVMFVKTGLVPGDRQRLEMEAVGEGRLLLFRDGQKFEGTWKKAGPKDRLQLLDDQGLSMLLDRGNIWISAVPTDRTVTF